MKFLLLLLIAHFLGDFVLQPNSWVKSKFENGLKSSGFWKHITIHAFLLLLIGLLLPNHIFALLIILVSHIMIDGFKIIFLKNTHNETYRLYAFIIDQLLHILVIFVVAFNTSMHMDWDAMTQPNVLLILLGYLFLTQPSSSIIKVLLSPYTNEVELPKESIETKDWKDLFFQRNPNKEIQQSLKNGGKYIGILERILVFTFIIIGQWAAVGFLITAKSVFRFGDLNQGKNRQFTEYVLIGTLLSFGFAIFISLMVQVGIRNQ